MLLKGVERGQITGIKGRLLLNSHFEQSASIVMSYFELSSLKKKNIKRSAKKKNICQNNNLV